ncbi:MAG: 23S rRNA (adenine(2503)-C(2))-methyltransferase RlmN [Eubacteriales bacterium]|nr:23S rRNA (adenine(2503)-C(2))-methyltransferase RlmN [Eubacteriales bacterium]
MIEICGKCDIKSMLPEELEVFLKELGQPGFRAGQIFSWLSRGCGSFDEMTNLPLSLRETLKSRCHLYAPNQIDRRSSSRDGTVKQLWELYDGNAVETVVMRYSYGDTVCISTQVGCRQGCAFCASAIGGLVRSLSPSEMLDEVLYAERDSGKPLSHIVLMGIGEPLDNFDNVMRFLDLINHPKGRGFGMRRISLSTCGLIEKFDRLADNQLQLTLSVSLHAPDDETRSRIMPANRGRGVDALMEACGKYMKKTGRRISFEYAMIDGVNDSEAQARLLAGRMKEIGGHVNLIPLNQVEEREFRPSRPENVRRFQQILQDSGVNVTVRRRLGGDLDAACGQLRRRVLHDGNAQV